MDHFNYKNSELHAENVSVAKIAEEVGTPFYCYSTATLQRHYNVIADEFKDINATICYAVKANSNIAVLKTLANLGSGADTVSEGEIRRALKAGIPADKIVFSGVGKTRDEMRYALEQDIMQFNVESESELNALNEVAASVGKKAPIALRVNPNVDAKTHEKITTGRKTDKFGIAWEKVHDMYAKADALDNIDIVAISTHIGSQLLDLQPFNDAFEKVTNLVQDLKDKGYSIKRVDLGGGLGIPYTDENPPHPQDYAKLIAEKMKAIDCDLVLEPGRVIAGNAGILVSKVIYTKEAADKNFVIIDAAMNDLVRPTMYSAEHEVISYKENSATDYVADIVGPVCETGDILAKDISLAKPAEGDLIIIRTAGAYGAVMANTYNSRLLIPEVLVSENKFSVIRSRPSYEDMLSDESIPDWV